MSATVDIDRIPQRLLPSTLPVVTCGEEDLEELRQFTPTAADTAAIYQGLLAWAAIDRGDSGCAQRARFLWFIGNNLNAGPTQVATLLECQKSQALNLLREYSAVKASIISRLTDGKNERTAHR